MYYNNKLNIILSLIITFILHSLFIMIVEMKIVPKKSLSLNDFYTLELKMPQVLPKHDDEYFCTSVNISNEEIYIKKFDPNADSSRIHHIIVFGCKNLYHRTHLYPNHWPCSHAQLCHGMRVIYAWGRNAPSLQLPQDVGFHVGGTLSDISFLVLQAHYAHPLSERDSSGVSLLYTIQPQPYVAGIFLLASLSGLIPPNQLQSHVDINCRLNRDPINVFAYRVHAHALGTVISGYRYSHMKKKWDLIAKGNPQWPQAFYPMDKEMQIDSRDIIAARCTYNSSSRTTLTQMGSTAGDEMCNLYLMYYSDNPNLIANDESRQFFYSENEQRSDMESCEDIEFDSKFYLNLPEGNDQPLPRNLTLEQSAFGQHTKSHPESEQKLEFFQDPDWSSKDFQLGQVTAVDFDTMGNVVIFHRGKHVWNELSFDSRNNYRRIQNGPISQSTIITIDTKTRKIIDSWGENLFYMPHGLTIDRQNNSVWLTDVAMHQVFRYSLDKLDTKNYRKISFVLGERFVPGNDDKHFCKPTSVAIDYSNREFYVADGYCNSRIIRFSSDGKYLNHWGHELINSDIRNRPPPNSLNIPHKILLIDHNENMNDDEKNVCIADRENGRIECFLAPYGQFRFQIQLPEFNGRLFSIAYSKNDNILYAVNGPSLMPPINQQMPNVIAFAFDFETQKPLATFAPKSTGTFNQPHDIAVSPSGDEVFVVEIGPNKIWKFINLKNINNHHQQFDEKNKNTKLQQIDDEESKKLKSIKPQSNNNEIDKKNVTISNLNFSFELLQIRTKEFREKVWSNNMLYFLLLVLFLFIIILNIHNTAATLSFCSTFASSIVNTINNKINNNCSKLNSERIRFSDVLKSSSSSKRKSTRTKLDKRYGGFNRLPLNEEESDLVIITDDDDDDDDDNEDDNENDKNNDINDDSDVLEDFSLSQKKKNNNHVI